MQRFWQAKLYIALSVGILFQIFIFRAYVLREGEGYYGVYGDQNWYLFFHHKIFDALINHEWAKIVDFLRVSPWGGLYFIQSALTQLTVGVGRLGASSINLIYFLFTQVFVFWVVKRHYQSVKAAFIAWLLFLAMHTTLRTSGPSMNLANYHMDLNFYFLIIVTLGLMIASGCFLDRKFSVLFGIVVGFTVASRLVGLFIYLPILFSFGVILLALLYKRSSRKTTLIRVKNLLIASGIFGVLAFPFTWIAREALYGHYFRFLLDKQFSDTKTQLYNMNSKSKFEEAYQLFKLIVIEDFGWTFLCALILAIIIIMGVRSNKRKANTEIWSIYFLAWFTLLSFAIHWSFKIKSDHLTRMTSAPLFWIIILFLFGTQPLIQLKTSKLRYIALSLLIAVPIIGHARFYFSRNHNIAGRLLNATVTELYETIFRLTALRGNTAPGFSVDHIKNFELGAMYSFNVFAYERYQVLMSPNGQMGAVVDEPIDWPRTVEKIDVSDIVLLSENDVYKNEVPFFPFGKSVKTFHNKVQEKVRNEFCLIKTFQFEENTKSLYFKPNATWPIQIKSMAKFDRTNWPDGTKILHVPWRPNDRLEMSLNGFTASEVFGLHMQGQRGSPTRTPKKFVARFLLGEEQVAILTEVNAAFDDLSIARWILPKAVRADRIIVEFSENSGDPDFLTLVTIRPLVRRNCEGL